MGITEKKFTTMSEEIMPPVATPAIPTVPATETKPTDTNMPATPTAM